MSIFSTLELNTFFNSISKTPDALRQKFTLNRISLNSWYQQAPFYQTPYIQFEGAIIPLGRPSLRRCFENLIYDWLYEENEQCKQDYENFLENYVGERLLQAKLCFLNEVGIHQMIGLDSRCCDYLVEDESTYILIEVKNKALNEAIPVVAQSDLNIMKFESTLMSGQKQLDVTLDKCKALSRFREKVFYRLIVTQSELWFRDTCMIDVSQNREDPIWIISLQDFDQIIELIINGTTTFTIFLDDARKRNQNPDTSLFSVAQLLDKHPYNNIGLPKHLSLEFTKMADSIKNHLET